MVVHPIVYSYGLLSHVYGSSFMYTQLENRFWLHNFVSGLHGSMCMCLLMGLCAGKLLCNTTMFKCIIIIVVL